MSEQLKPCPFCGGEAFVSEVHVHDDRWASVSCNRCHASTVGSKKIQRAIDEWNTRAPSPSALVAALEAAHKEACARARDSGIRGGVWTALDVGVETGLLKAIDIVKELSK